MASKHRVLITGASGLLGRAIFKQFCNSDKWEVLGLAHSRATGALKKVNLLDFEETERVVKEFKPHVLIHSAAERRPDIVENDEETSMKLNVEATKALVSTINELNSGLEIPGHFMLYISTDYVFDGTNPPYKPLDQPNPLNKYGKSKLAGEQVMKMYPADGGILRVPILYGNVEYLKESAVTGLFNREIYAWFNSRCYPWPPSPLALGGGWSTSNFLCRQSGVSSENIEVGSWF